MIEIQVGQAARVTLTGGLVEVEPRVGRKRRTRRGQLPAWSALTGSALGAAVFLVGRTALPDDGYITLGYARNLAEHGEWGLVAGMPSNTATSPLNVWLLAAGTWVTGQPVVAVGLVLMLALGLAGWWAAHLARDLRATAALPVVLLGLLATSPLLVSTLGLESYLVAAVLVGVARYAVAGRPVACGVLVGAAVLVRPDLVVPAAVFAVGLLGIRKGLRATVTGALVAAPWHLFAWFALGGALPDTAWFKIGSGGFPGPHGADPIPIALVTHYGPGMPVAAAVTALVLVAGWVLCPLGGRPAVVVAAAGVAHLLAIALPGTTPYLWYMAPALACSMLALALAAGPQRPVALVGVVLVASAAAATFVRPTPWFNAPMFSNGAVAAQYLAAGADLGRLIPPGTTVGSPGEVGALAFACRCALVDQFSDRARAQPYLDSSWARLNSTWRPDPGLIRPTDFRLDVGADPRPPGAFASWPVGLTPGRWLVLRPGSR